MRKSMLVLLTASVLLTGCSLTAGQEQKQTPPPSQTKPNGNNGSQPGTGGTDTTQPPSTTPEPVQKSEAQIQQEIKDKLARMTRPKGYMLDHSEGKVIGAKSLDDVAEQLRKKGYAPDIAKKLAASFYKQETDGIKLIATEGWAGVFDPNKEATFTKKNKWTWSIDQKHPESGLYDPHTAHYEVEMLKDGSYRLNVWTTTNL